MMNIKNICFLILTTLLAVPLANAQQLKIGASGAGVAPLGELNSKNSFGVGGNAEAKIMLGEDFAFGLTAGYLFMHPESEPNELDIDHNYEYSIIPILISGEYFLTFDKVKPYLGAGVGYYINSYDYILPVVEYSGGPTVYKETDESNAFPGIQPKAGVLIALGDRWDLNAYGHYNIFWPHGNDFMGNEPIRQFMGLNLGLMYTFNFRAQDGGEEMMQIEY